MTASSSGEAKRVAAAPLTETPKGGRWWKPSKQATTTTFADLHLVEDDLDLGEEKVVCDCL